MNVTYYLPEGPRTFDVVDVSYQKFMEAARVFNGNTMSDKYDLFVYGGFSSYMVDDVQWKTKDINLFIARQKLLDVDELKTLMYGLLDLAEQFNLRADIKYFTQYDSPDDMKWGNVVQFIVPYKKMLVNEVVVAEYQPAEVLPNNLYVVNSLYEMSAKDLERINQGLILYKGFHLKKLKV